MSEQRPRSASSSSSDGDMPMEVSLNKTLQEEKNLRKVAPIKKKIKKNKKKKQSKLKKILEEQFDEDLIKKLEKKEERIQRLKKESKVISMKDSGMHGKRSIGHRLQVIAIGARKRFKKAEQFQSSLNSSLYARGRLNRKNISVLKG